LAGIRKQLPAPIYAPPVFMARLASVPRSLGAFAAFIPEHQRCGDLDGGADDERVWMACRSGAAIAHLLIAEGSKPRCWQEGLNE
jgi:hypothetical protein